MFRKTVKRAKGAVEDAAIEAAFGLVFIILACGAFLFAAVGFAWWLSTFMAVYYAMFLTALLTAVCAGLVYLWGLTDPATDEKEEEAEESADASPLAMMSSLLGSKNFSTRPLDAVVTSLVAKQFKSAPVSTLAAATALGAVIGMMTDGDGGEEDDVV